MAAREITNGPSQLTESEAAFLLDHHGLDSGSALGGFVRQWDDGSEFICIVVEDDDGFTIYPWVLGVTLLNGRAVDEVYEDPYPEGVGSNGYHSAVERCFELARQLTERAYPASEQ